MLVDDWSGLLHQVSQDPGLTPAHLSEHSAKLTTGSLFDQVLVEVKEFVQRGMERQN